MIGGQLAQLDVVDELVQIRGPFNHVKVVPVTSVVQVIPDHADEWRDAGDGAQHEMLGCRLVHQKDAFGSRAYGHGVADLHTPHQRGEFAFWNQFDEDLQCRFVGRRDD